MTKKETESESENKDQDIKIKNASDAILGKSLDNLKLLVIEFAEKRKNILLTGAPGVGKELFSDLYATACNKEKCSINMTGIPSELIDSTLFGYEKGAFTGAMANGADGIITEDSAASNCFFFDELGDVPSYTQGFFLQLIFRIYYGRCWSCRCCNWRFFHLLFFYYSFSQSPFYVHVLLHGNIQVQSLLAVFQLLRKFYLPCQVSRHMYLL